MEDTRIVDLYLNREESAIEETAKQYGTRLRALSFGIVGDKETAEECENDTYWRAWQRMPPDRPHGLRLYLGAITRHLALDRWRASHADKRGGGEVALSLEELGACVGTAHSAEDEAERTVLAALLSAFLGSLPRAECDLFVRRYWYMDSVAQIAARYGYSESKVKMTLKRTRDKLRSRLEKEGYIL